MTELGVCTKNLPGGIQHINTQENLCLARLNSVYICEQWHLMVPLEPQTRYDPCWGQWQDGYIVEWLRDEDLLLMSMTFYVWPWKHYFLSLTLHSTYETTNCTSLQRLRIQYDSAWKPLSSVPSPDLTLSKSDFLSNYR